ncbi:MAG: AAA family ATPase [Chromatiales bacterium]|nr:AAA family ATPase [Chromatiales bacterium]
MYERFYGFKETPFGLTPNTDYYFAYPDHQEALNVLLVALRMGEGFIKITGEVGTGKTLVCRKLLNILSQNNIITAYIPNPSLPPAQLMRAVADELCIKTSLNHDGQTLQRLISERLIKYKAQGKRLVLLIDEAQTIPLPSLEAIRLLTNLETEKSKLLQVVLFGQPELNRHLDDQSVRQVKQRITFSHHIKPMSREGATAYLQHRLKVAGYRGKVLFSAWIVNRLYRASQGIPRLINILAHKMLLAAYGEGSDVVTGKHVARAIQDTEGAIQPFAWRKWVWLGVSGLGLSSAAGAGVYLFIGGGL